jgi:hypothetical protein
LLRGEPVSAPRVSRFRSGDGDGERRNSPSGAFEKLGQKLRSFLGERDGESGH